MTMIGTQPGKLRHRIVIQQQNTTQDASGQPIASLPTLATVWAHVEDVGGLESWRGFRIEATTDVVVEIRYLSTVTPSMQISHDGRTLDITSVRDPDNHKRRMFLFCREVING